MASAERAMHLLVKRHEKHLSRAETVHFTRCLQEPRRVPQFYCTPKVHTTPWTTHPIVSCVNSRMGDLSKWIDAQLQRVVHLCPSHLKDSQTLLQLLKRLRKLPTTAVLSVSDAKSMYTNIQTTHGLNTLRRWLLVHAQELPQNFPTDTILETLELVMQNNIFQLDNTFWMQLTGTAMGTSVACVCATIYYSCHEETKLLRAFEHNSRAPTTLMPCNATQIFTKFYIN